MLFLILGLILVRNLVSEIQSIVNSLLSRAAKTDPVMLSILQEIVNELNRIGIIVDPAPFVSSKVSIGLSTPPGNVLNFTYRFTPNNLILEWTSPSVDFLFYEIRLGTVWDTADRLLTTGNLSAFLDPITVGTHTYLIKAINSNNIYSLNAVSLDVIVPPIGTFNIIPTVIGNFIALDWDEPESTFKIDYYRIRKDGIVIASQIPGTFFSRQEPVGGLFAYGITAFDIAGNSSAEMIVTATVSPPSDFEFEEALTSDFSGTIVNGKVDLGKLFVAINNTETYEDHFINNSWASPQAQIDAGYPLWLSPFEATASYEEIFDFGVIFTNVIVNISWLTETISGSFTLGVDSKVSDDDISYSSSFTTPTFFVTSARYVKVKFNFTGSDDKALLAFFEFIVSLNVKRENDGGEEDVFAADTNGTVISFNKAFKFVESITVSPASLTVKTIAYDFAGGVDPVSFKVKVWDSAGVRVDELISWKARGVL